jgi:SET domain-containing protein
VFAQSNIEKGRLIVHYEGELLTNEEGERRHAKYSTQDGSFLFFFSHKRNKLWYVIQIV